MSTVRSAWSVTRAACAELGAKKARENTRARFIHGRVSWLRGMSERRDQGDLWPPPYPGENTRERFTEYDQPRASQKPTESEREVLSVAELGRVIEQGVQRAIPRAVWVEGEVVGARPAASGHLYFTLKDQQEEASIDVVMYRASLTNRTRAMVKDGARLRVHGRPAYWTQRGKLQFTSDRLQN